MSNADAIYEWWFGLKDDRGAVARLRRAGDLTTILMEPETLKLARRLKKRPDELEGVAVLAAVLAEVRDDAPHLRVAKAMGSPEGQPCCSALRFRRLLEAPPGEAQLTAFRRALAQLGRSANVRDLAESLLDWNDRRRQRWLYDYYHTENPAVGQNQETAL